MSKSFNFSKKSFAVYGLGATGTSVINFFDKIGVKNYIIWDDNKNIKKDWKLNEKKKRNFLNLINFVDYIVVSPGINIKKIELKKALLKNKSKIITDLDLFYIFNPKIKSIVVTGTNGKSTTCKIIEHLLNKNKIKAVLGGNIGKPALSLNLKKTSLVIIEASSFQLERSKFIKPDYAIILNITNDHLDWHGSMKNYINSKLKIFLYQEKSNFAFINDKRILRIYRRKNYLGKLNFVTPLLYKRIKNKIKNSYLSSEANEENMSFVFALSKVFKINKKSFIKSLNSFKGLPHRHEIFYKKNKLVFINDSKATTFQATKFALQSNKDIFWIVGGMPKVGEKFNLGKLKNNIAKSYIIGNHMKIFKKNFKGKINFQLSKTLKNALISIFKDIKNFGNKKTTILLSPASASYDQFINFEERGNQFKKLVRKYAKKHF
ncbi:MAG: UDP-N-acetylmuramoyl-L-alanine--D-glutamate ligase [Candidatus Marinimicrobia bacterium]|nr:UDP-N-acetylmuramoyl-L-alanine--D-glutamate ligase [Candidatus Neomarinimicrobiota bacterium]|tara:strand:- start:25315 stop:26616 length:1302 start_codon:yes stop_codon:yes gene_type:complete